MAVIRINPTTALTQLRQAGSELRRLATDAAPLSAAPHLTRHLERFDERCASSRVPVAVWLEDGTSADEAAAWLLGAPPEQWSADRSIALATIGHKPVELLFGPPPAALAPIDGDIAPALIVWRRPATGGLEPLPGFDQLPVIVTTRVADQSGLQQIVVAPSADAGVLARLLAGPAAAQALDLLHADAAAATLERLAAVAGLALEQEGRAVRAKRALAQDRLAALQARAVPIAVTDLLSGVRLRMQRTFTDFMRGLEDRFATLLSSATADLWKQLDGDLAAITRFDEEKRVKALALKLAAADEERWLGRLRAALVQHCVGDIAAVRDMLRQLGADIEKDVADGGGPPLVVHFQQMTDQRLVRLIDNALVPQRKYQGEMPQQGFFQYLMMARRYQTVAFMLMSAFGLSFIRSAREFMLPAAIVLLSLGTLQVVQSVKRERAETLQKELEKLRELLRLETRRMIGQVETGWLAAVNQHLGDQLMPVIAQLESSAREQASRAAADTAEDKLRLQRQVQGCDSAEKKVLALQKTREGFAQGVAQVRGELRSLIAAAIRGAAA